MSNNTDSRSSLMRDPATIFLERCPIGGKQCLPNNSGSSVTHFAFEPVHTRTWYFINNNLGFSLNMLGRFDEGEQLCRAAIAIDGHRPNGFKILGLALRGQGRYAGAAECYIKATRADASDARSLKLLEELLEQQPQLSFELGPQLECCRKAVAVAAQQRARSPQPGRFLFSCRRPRLEVTP